MKNDVTLIITACDRNDLLERTLKSFVEFNTYPIKKLVIRDDCGLKNVYDNMCALIVSLKLPFGVDILPPGQLGQGKSIDTLMSYVKTPYVFHSEEDWSYYKPSFIEKSMEVLAENPKISHVWIRPPEGMVHPRWSDEEYKTKKSKIPYRLVKRSANTNAWSFNPHLARISDYTKTYCQIKDMRPETRGEDAIGIYYRDLGFETAWLLEGYVKHIGGDKSTFRPSPYRFGASKL